VKSVPRNGITVVLALSGLLCTFVAAVAAQPPGWGLSFPTARSQGRVRSHAFRGKGRPRGHFRSHAFQGKIRPRGRFRSHAFRGKGRPGKFFPVAVPIIDGFYDRAPVVVTSPPARTIIINQSTPPQESRKPAEPRLCPWIWSRETGKKQCLDEAFPSQGEGVILRAPMRAE
jgi:hypothetical protein